MKALPRNSLVPVGSPGRTVRLIAQEKSWNKPNPARTFPPIVVAPTKGFFSYSSSFLVLLGGMPVSGTGYYTVAERV